MVFEWMLSLNIAEKCGNIGKLLKIKKCVYSGIKYSIIVHNSMGLYTYIKVIIIIILLYYKLEFFITCKGKFIPPFYIATVF